MSHAEIVIQFDEEQQGLKRTAFITWNEDGGTKTLTPSSQLEEELNKAITKIGKRVGDLDETLGKKRSGKDKARMTKKDREKTQEEIDEIDEQLKAAKEEKEGLRELGQLVKLLADDRIHFRIFMKVDDVEVDLVRTKNAPEEAGG